METRRAQRTAHVGAAVVCLAACAAGASAARAVATGTPTLPVPVPTVSVPTVSVTQQTSTVAPALPALPAPPPPAVTGTTVTSVPAVTSASAPTLPALAPPVPAPAPAPTAPPAPTGPPAPVPAAPTAPPLRSRPPARVTAAAPAAAAAAPPSSPAAAAPAERAPTAAVVERSVSRPRGSDRAAGSRIAVRATRLRHAVLVVLHASRHTRLSVTMLGPLPSCAVAARSGRAVRPGLNRLRVGTRIGSSKLGIGTYVLRVKAGGRRRASRLVTVLAADRMRLGRPAPTLCDAAASPGSVPSGDPLSASSALAAGPHVRAAVSRARARETDAPGGLVPAAALPEGPSGGNLTPTSILAVVIGAEAAIVLLLLALRSRLRRGSSVARF